MSNLREREVAEPVASLSVPVTGPMFSNFAYLSDAITGIVISVVPASATSRTSWGAALLSCK